MLISPRKRAHINYNLLIFSVLKDHQKNARIIGSVSLGEWEQKWVNTEWELHSPIFGTSFARCVMSRTNFFEQQYTPPVWQKKINIGIRRAKSWFDHWPSQSQEHITSFEQCFSDWNKNLKRRILFCIARVDSN